MSVGLRANIKCHVYKKIQEYERILQGLFLSPEAKTFLGVLLVCAGAKHLEIRLCMFLIRFFISMKALYSWLTTRKKNKLDLYSINSQLYSQLLSKLTNYTECLCSGIYLQVKLLG